MSEELEQPGNENGEILEAPNKQAVGLDPPWVEGTGGSSEEAAPVATESATKAELLEQAQARGLDVTEANTKAEIKAALEDS